MEDKYLEEVYDKYSFQSLEDMYASVGYGGITANQILNKLNSLYKSDMQTREQKEYSLSDYKNDGEIEIKGFSNLLTKIARCCNPLPGDEIIGYISRGNGITIHRKDCDALKNLEFERLIECSWHKNDNKDFVGSITMLANDTNNLMADLTKRLNDEKVNLVGLVAKKRQENKAIITIQLSIKDKAELDYLINKLKQLPFAIEVYRTV